MSCTGLLPISAGILRYKACQAAAKLPIEQHSIAIVAARGENVRGESGAVETGTAVMTEVVTCFRWTLENNFLGSCEPAGWCVMQLPTR